MMADDMETDLPVKIETDTDESDNENGIEQNGKMEDDQINGEKNDKGKEGDQKNDAITADPAFKALADCQIKKRVAIEFAKLIINGQLELDDLDERSRKFLANTKAEDAVQFARHLGQMLARRQDVGETNTRAEFVKRQLALLRVQLKKQNRAYLQEPVGGPDKDKIEQLLARTGYSMSYLGSQRSYGGPPPGWEGEEPVCDNNVYISGLPRDMFEDELVPMLEQCGRIWVLRLVISPLNNFSRGFCFLTYCSKDEADRAVQKLNNLELRDGHTMKVNLNNAHSTLFIKSLPQDKTDEEIREEIEGKTEGMTNFRVLRRTASPEVEGIPVSAFVSFSNQKSLGAAKRGLVKGETLVFGAQVDVSQADARGKPPDDCLNTVTEVHVHDMPDSLTAEDLKGKLAQYGEIKRVSKAGDHAIVFFETNEAAVKAMVAMKGAWRQTSTIFYTKENEERNANKNSPSSAPNNPYFCTVETGLGQDFGKILVDISMGVPHKPPRQKEQKKSGKDSSRRGGMRGRGGRGNNAFSRGRSNDKLRRGLLPLPMSAQRPNFRGGLMPPPFGYMPQERMGYRDRGGYHVDDMGYDFNFNQQRYGDRYGLLDGFGQNNRFGRQRRYNEYGDFGDYRPHNADRWQDRWGDFDLPSAVGPRDMGRGGGGGGGGSWQDRGSVFLRGSGRGVNKRKMGGWMGPQNKQQGRNRYN